MSQAMFEARPSAVCGWSGFLAGAAALLLALMMFWSGPLAPQPEPVAGPSLVEKVTDAARAVVSGDRAEAPPPPPEPTRDIDARLGIAVAGLGGAAIVLGFAGFARSEKPRPAFSAITRGGGAILFQLVTGFILILICLMLMGSLSRGGDSIGEIFTGILEAIGGVFTAIGEFFGNLFGGLFGG